MASRIERQVSPIPPGRYWMLINAPNIQDFDAWLRDMQGGVRIETTSLDATKGRAVQFVIFNVAPGRFPFLNAEQFGFPNTAGPEITNVQDVVQNPQNKNPEDVAVDVIRKAGEVAENALDFAPVALLLLLAYAASRS